MGMEPQDVDLQWTKQAHAVSARLYITSLLRILSVNDNSHGHCVVIPVIAQLAVAATFGLQPSSAHRLLGRFLS